MQHTQFDVDMERCVDVLGAAQCHASGMSCYVMLCHVMSCYIMLCDVVWCCVMRFVTWYNVSCDDLVSPDVCHGVVLWHAKSCHVSCYVAAMLYGVTLWCHSMEYHVMCRYGMHDNALCYQY